MEKTIAPIPALYACYLLRSIARKSSSYIGSTPNPRRRLKQHNGEAKGGAVRTSRDSLRPWEMTCLVTGFPSKIAALQFEWAWQNPQLTRHIASDARITQSRMTTRISPRTGKVRKRSARPRLSLTDRLANLHLLLRASSFVRWPLKLTFYSEDVYRVWSKWSEQTSEKVRPSLQVVMDESSRGYASVPQTEGSAPMNATGINALDVGYSSHKLQLEKAQNTFGAKANLQCAVCHKSTPPDGATTLICTNESCTAVSHLQCLSRSFLRSEEVDSDALVPVTGSCPACKKQLQWADLVKDLTLRMRGEKEIKAISKPKGLKKGTAVPTNSVDVRVHSSDEDDDDPVDIVLEEGECRDFADSGDDEVHTESTTTNLNPGYSAAVFKRTGLARMSTEAVIDDSEWDEAELLT